MTTEESVLPTAKIAENDTFQEERQSDSPTKFRSSTPSSSGGRSLGGDGIRPRLISQSSEERRTQALKHRGMHPAEQKRRTVHHAAIPLQNRLFVPAGSEMAGGYRKGPHSFNTLRRLSRADFSSIKRAGNKMKNLQYTRIFGKFSRYTTIHGISHAALAPTPRWKNFWYAVFFMCFTILAIQIFYLIWKYLQHPKSVDLDLKFENAPFPSVTICNLNPYKASSLGNDGAIKSTMDAFKNIMNTTGRSEGIAAALRPDRSFRTRRQFRLNDTSTAKHNDTKVVPNKKISDKQRKYLQVYAQCYCEVNRISGERKRGSCYAAYKGKISIDFDEKRELYNFHPTRCLCQLDWITKAIWPCFPYNTWKEHICVECNEMLGHCPMRFRSNAVVDEFHVCLCHKDYNHCVANNDNGEIPEIFPGADPNDMNFTEAFIQSKSANLYGAMPTTPKPTTTQAPELVQAMGFEDLKDEIAITAKARENLMFAVEEKPLSERVQLSQPKDELILKCSFNQRDCNIKNDFKLYYDPTYGNCYTFNWNRTEPVTAHRAGANYGLRVLLYANVSEYLPTTEAVGFRITIHDKWVVPFPDAFGHTAPTGFMSSYGVRMKQFIRIEEPHGRCKEGGEEEETYIYKGYMYSIEGCHRSCTQNEIVRQCGCADPMFPAPDDTERCKVSDPTARDCIKNVSSSISEAITQATLENCKCHQPCKETGYEVSYSPARWPSGTSKLLECEVNDDLCTEKYRKNAALIQVFYEELNYETLIESPAYTFSSLLADLGGVSGLWIGISVVSVVEVVQLLNFFIQAYFQRRKTTSASSLKMNSNSLNSLNAQLPRRKHSSMSSVKSVKSIKSIKSSIKSFVADDSKSTIKEESEEDDHQSLSEPSRKTTYSYVPPGVELPCTCLYGSHGNLVFMKPLCPFHGYMVRRNTEYDYDYDSSEHEDEGEEEEEEQEEQEQDGNGMTVDEKNALCDETEREEEAVERSHRKSSANISTTSGKTDGGKDKEKNLDNGGLANCQ